jgi:primosomal protein N' (replication factor Y)
VFAPLRRLGLIVVDEEHDPSYKQESDPRYDARTVAAKRASLEGAVAVFGSATPRPESWASLERLELGGRITGRLPPVRIVDLRREAGYPLSAPLLEGLERVVERGDKAILLLNRRGMAPALHCRACGATIRCEDCDVALVLHGDGSLRCHHCGRSEPAPEVCPACASAELARIGAGTQRLERELEAALPGLRRFRLDADTVEQRGVAETLRAFAGASSAALIGTQMVAKGHHFTGVALAAVVACSCRRSSPTRARSSLPHGTTSPASSRASSSGGVSLRIRRSGISCALSSRGRRKGSPSACCPS